MEEEPQPVDLKRRFDEIQAGDPMEGAPASEGECWIEMGGGRRFKAHVDLEFAVWKVQKGKSFGAAIRLDGIDGVIFPEHVERVIPLEAA